MSMDFRSPGGNPFGVLNPQQNAPSSFGQNVQQQQQPQSGGGGGQGGPPQLQLGNELDEVQTENFGFMGLAGDTKVRIFREGFNEQNMPMPTASLLAIAPKRGLFAAAGPTSFVLSETSKLRQTFKPMPKAPDGSSPITDFEPQLSLPLPTKVSHVAFTADEKHLLLGAALGGIAVYSVDNLLAGNTSSLFELACDPIIDMKPIPTVEKADLICVLTGPGWGQPGQVNMVDLSTKQIHKNLKSGVTAISWSPKGKQIVCGGITGGLCWIQPDGQGKGEIPGVPGVQNHFVSSLLWVETHIFYIVHTPAISQPPTLDNPPDNNSVHHILQRSGSQYNFNKVFDSVSPFGMPRATSHFFLHLKTWPPKLQDLIILANTASADIGIVCRYSNEGFQPCSISDDSRRAGLPLNSNSSDTSPIGFSLDLSITKSELVENPISGQSTRSVVPTPAVMILNNDGLIIAYWLIYQDAVRQENLNAAYPGLAVYGGGTQTGQQSVPQTPARQTFGTGPGPTSAGGSAFGQPSTTPAATPAFSQPSQMGGGMFGKALSYGSPQAPQTGAPAFGSTSALGSRPTPAFGSPSTLGMGANRPAFGSTSAMSSGGAAQSAFGSTTPMGGAGGSQPAFGSTSALGSSGGFGAFANKSGGSAFGQPSQLGSSGGSAFGQPSQLGSGGGSAFGQPSALGGGGSAFGQPSALGANKPAGGAFGAAAGGASGGASGGFGRFAGGGGFLAAGSAAPLTPAFLQSSGGTSAFGQKQDDSFSGLGKPQQQQQQQQQQQPSAFGQPAQSSNFKLTSSFQSSATPTSQAQSQPSSGSGSGGGGMFGSAFGSSLGGALDKPGAAAIPEEDMDDEDDEPKKPRDGPSGASMFDVGAIRNKEAATTPPATGAPAQGGLFANALKQGQQSSPSVSSPTGGAFGSGLFGSAMKANDSKQAEQKSGAFGTTPSSTSTPTVGTGLFGSAMKASDTKSPGNFGAFGSPQPSTSAFGSPAPQSAFGAPASAVKSPPASGGFGGLFASAAAQNDKAKSESPAPENPKQEPSRAAKSEPPPDMTAVAASKGLPDDSGDEGEIAEGADAGDAPLPPDFTTDRSAKAGWGSSKMALPGATAKTPAPEKKAEEAPLPPDFTTDKSAKAGWGSNKMSLPSSVFSKPSPASPGTPPIKKEPTPTPPTKKEPESTPPASGLFSNLKKDEPSSGSSSNPLKKTPKAGAGKGMLAGTKGKMSAGKDDSKKKFTMADVADGNVTPFSIFGAAGKPTDTSAASPSAAGGLFGGGSGDKKSGGGGFSGFTFQEYKPGDSDDEDEDEDEGRGSGEEEGDEHDEDEGSYDEEEEEEEEEGDEEEEEYDEDEEEEDVEWIDSAEGSELGSPDVTVSLGGHKVSAPTMGRHKVGGAAPRKSSLTPKASPAKSHQQYHQQHHQQHPSQLPISTKKLSPLKPKVSSPVRSKVSMPKFPPAKDDKEERERLEKEAKERAVAEAKRVQAEKARLFEEREMQRAKEREAARIKLEELLKEEQLLLDKEKESTQRLSAPFEPSAEVPTLPSINIEYPTVLKGRDAYMEATYQSITATVNSVRLASRQLEAYIKYNKDYKPGPLEDMCDDSNCGFGAMDALMQEADKLLTEVKATLGKDTLGKVSQEVTKVSADHENLEAKSQEIASLLLQTSHPALVRSLRALPLTLEQKKQQNKLRRKIPTVRRLLLEAEENFTLLQARVASHNKTYKTNKGNIKPPTHEAVRNTLHKMTSYARQKADDVDALEENLRRMRMRSTSPMMSRGNTPSASAGPSRSNTFTSPRRGSTPLRRVREGTPMGGVGGSAATGTNSPIAARMKQNTGSGYLTSASPETFAYYENTPEGKKSRLRHSKLQAGGGEGDDSDGDSIAATSDDDVFADENNNDDDAVGDMPLIRSSKSKASFPAFSSFDRNRDRERIEGRRSWVEQGERKPKRLTHSQEVVLAGLEAEGQSPLPKRTGGGGIGMGGVGGNERDFAWYEGDRKFRREAKVRMARVFKRVGVVETTVQG